MDIKSVIQRHGMRIQDVAAKMGIKQSSLSGMITGNPTVKTLRLIAENCGCSVAEFFLDELPADFQKPTQEKQELPMLLDEEPETEQAQGVFVCPHCGAGVSFNTFVVKKPNEV